MMVSIVLWFIALGQVENDQVSIKSLVMWLMLIIVTAVSSVWFGQQAQRNQMDINLGEYTRRTESSVDDYDYLQDGEEDAFNPDFPEEQARKGGTYYGNE